MRFPVRGKASVATLAVVCLAAVAAGVYMLLFPRGVPEAKELRGFVHSKPPVPVVFTSRSQPASFLAAAPAADGFTFPGTIPWAAAEGRLRLLNPDGKVYELTWGRHLPDGSTLIDVMSPSVSLDGQRILFAGRKAPPDPGRWRLYQVNRDGTGLRPLTGGASDPGCVRLPPLRYAADGKTLLGEEERKKLDYDDVDPIDRGKGEFIFASSRLPDLGRDHSRRSTQIWRWRRGQSSPYPLTANRNNDRWPFMVFAEEIIIFSLWSRNREAVTEDGKDIRPLSSGGSYSTAGTDGWMAARVHAGGTHFGFAVKIPEPVWRPRPLFNGRIVFMTEDSSRKGRFRLAQADWGYLRAAPSALAVGSQMPRQTGGTLLYGPAQLDGQELTAGCPSPCPTNLVLCSAAPVEASPGAFALYLVPEEWSTPQRPQLLFDDPRLVDAEPVAVYPRQIRVTAQEPTMATAGSLRPSEMRLPSGRVFKGSFGLFENSMITVPAPDDFLGQQTDLGEHPVIPPPPNVKSVVFYAAHRDRFDDPVQPRIPGEWERLNTLPLDEHGKLRGWVPAIPGTPTVLAGLDEKGAVARWTSKAKDSAGRSATFYAIAGDHYSGTRPDGYHFCLGCHTGHTFIPADIRERIK